jgi:hypothetical protein
MLKRNYQIMIAVGGPALYEVWSIEGKGLNPTDHVHWGYFHTREDAQACVDRRIEQDCPSNAGQIN